MNTYENIKSERRGSGAWIYLNRPKAMNALSIKLLEEMESVLDEAVKDDAIKAIVIGGDKKAFCTGADLKEIMDSQNDKTPGKKDFLERIQIVFSKIRNYPKPIIAIVEGYALAGGLELVMCCDLVFASKSAKMGDAHSNFGIIPGAGGAAILPKKVGINRAKYLMFTGDYISSDEMERYGLVNKVFEDDKITQEVQKLVEKLSKKSTLVLREMKRLANISIDQTVQAALDAEALALRYHLRSYDLTEGLDAFQTKRNPEFKGY